MGGGFFWGLVETQVSMRGSSFASKAMASLAEDGERNKEVNSESA